VSGLRIVERSPADVLRRYLHQKNISLPGDYWQDAMHLVAQSIMDIVVSQIIEASRYERKPSRLAYRNGYRDSLWSAQQHEIPIRIPKLRRGTYYPSFLEDEQVEKIVSEFVTQAYVDGVRFEDVLSLLETLHVAAWGDIIADLHEALYDLIDTYQARALDVERVTLDLVPIEERGRRRYLAIAVSDNELLEHDITAVADDVFWQEFIRRIDGRSVRGVEYIAVSRIRHVVRLTHTNAPQAMLMAA
jgi:transposase-like protein